MQVEDRPLASIKPYDRNPRLNDSGVEAVATSIKEFGFRQPIVIDENDVIIVGHTRYKAALKLKLATVPVHVARGLNPDQARAYRLADNQTATLSTWHSDLLAQELLALQEAQFDLPLTGFSAEDLARFMSATDGKFDPMEEWQGMPDYDHQDLEAFQSIHIHFSSQADVDAFAKLIKQPITAETSWLWFPKQESKRLKKHRYGSAAQS
jgi:hypothetical protein